MTKREAVPYIDSEAEFYLSQTPDQRRRLPFAAPCISQTTVYRVQEQNRAESQPPAPAPAPKQL